MRRISSLAVLGVLALGALVPRPALAILSSNTIDATAQLGPNGRFARVGGPIACTAGEQLRIAIRVEGEAVGATAEGRAVLHCSGALQRWEVNATVAGRGTLASGPATVCATAVTRSGKQVTDQRSWCKAGVELLSH